MCEVKDYKMSLEYAADNLFGLSLEEQFILLNDLKETVYNTKDEWFIDAFNHVFSTYMYKLEEFIHSANKYNNLRYDIKTIFKINESKGFVDRFRYDYTSKERKYFDTIEKIKLIDPDKIYLDELSFKDDEEKEDFCLNIIRKYSNSGINYNYIPVADRVICLYKPIILDIFGYDIFNFIMESGKEFTMAVIEAIAGDMPNNTKSDLNNELSQREAMNTSTVTLFINDAIDFSVDEYALTNRYDHKKAKVNTFIMRPTIYEDLDIELCCTRTETLDKINSELVGSRRALNY